MWNIIKNLVKNITINVYFKNCVKWHNIYVSKLPEQNALKSDTPTLVDFVCVK